MLFIWALVVILKQGIIKLLIDMIKYHFFKKIESGLSELSRHKVCEGTDIAAPSW
jgi:hypothetical protein